jgi:Fur family transcriptional regulator, ferric uptake regulator
MKKHVESKKHTADVLRMGGFRATTSRIQLLNLLEKSGTPLSIQRIAMVWKGKAPDITTLYRSLTDLNLAGIVRRIDLNTGTAHFEYTPSRPHHHHIVCSDCGKVEELEHCSVSGLEKRLIQESEHFKSINSHNLEFFGRCTTCTINK